MHNLYKEVGYVSILFKLLSANWEQQSYDKEVIARVFHTSDRICTKVRKSARSDIPAADRTSSRRDAAIGADTITGMKNSRYNLFIIWLLLSICWQ